MERLEKRVGQCQKQISPPAMLTGFPFRVGGELLSHGLPQYHRRGGA